MSLKEDLIAARALIDTPETWCKSPGSVVRASGDFAFCAWWACAIAGGDRESMRHALTRALPWWFKFTMLGGGDNSSLIWYNDRPPTTHADIMALFDRAVAGAE